jgi:hypothetical protein
MNGFCDNCSCWSPCGGAEPRLPWWDRSRDDYQYNGYVWIDDVRCVIVESGQMVEWGTSGYMEPPIYEPQPMETIIVRPIVKWAGRVSR